ncbi:MAG TPA: YceI family protein [Bryobacteraceae bacterium]|jgi:polyisoprenoid-binding protein YceI
MTRVITWAAALLTCAGSLRAQAKPIDTEKSTMTVRVSKAGAFSAFGHDHDIAALLSGGTVDLSAHRVELRVDAKALRVQDRGSSEKDRADVQKTMLGPEVLDAERYPQIVFRSTSAESTGAGAWRVHGSLTLHGTSQPIDVEVLEKDGQYTGHAVLKQTDFGIKPVKVGGGAVRVKDEVRIEFDIRLGGK